MPDLTIITTSEVVPSDSWTYVTVSWNGTDVQVYYNGVNVQNALVVGTLSNHNISTRIGHDWYANDYFGKVDELAIWNRSLSESEIEFLYNGGNGTDFYQVNYSLPSPSENASSLVVELLNPEESEIITSLPYTLKCQATPTNLNLTNATFIITDLNLSVVYSNNQSVSSDASINISQSLTNLSDGEYLFNVVVCGTNSTGFICEQDIDSHSFSLNTTIIAPPVIITESNDIVNMLSGTGRGFGGLLESITPSIIKFFVVIVILTSFGIIIYFFIHEFLLKRLKGE